MEGECVMDGRRQAFFVVDNGVVLEHASRIGSNALALYVILACHARTGSGACYPSIKRLVQLMRRSRPVVFEALRTLQEHKLVAVEQRRSGNGGLTSNLYTLLPVAVSVSPDRAAASIIDEHAITGGVVEYHVSPDRAVVSIVDGGGKAFVPRVVSIVDEGSKAFVPRVVSIVDEGGQIDCLPLVNIVYSELD